LDTFSIARLLRITLVPLFSDENHYLPSLRISLGRELTQRRFSSAKIYAESDPPWQRADAGFQPMWQQQNVWMDPGHLVAQKQ
jgi:hypothetical protein